MFETLSHYSKTYFVQLKNNWVREALYRTNFLTTVIVDIVWIVVELCFFTVIYSNVDTIAGWTKPQVYFFLGVFFASDALFSTFFQTSFWRFSDLVHKGELDILLTKPISSLFLALTRWVHFTALFNVILGFVIMFKYAEPAGFSGGIHWALVFFWLAIGLTTQLLLRFAFSVWCFWTDRGWALARLYYQFYAFATKPDGLYPKFVRYTIMTFLPFAFIGSIPTRAMLHGLKASEYAWIGFILCTFFILNSVLWHKGLKRYQSVSS